MPKLNAGRLRHSLLVKKPVPTVDPSNGLTLMLWRQLPPVRAAIEPLSARDYVAAQQVKSQVNTRIVIRYRDDISPGCRLTDTSKNITYTVDGVLPDADSGREYLTLACSYADF